MTDRNLVTRAGETPPPVQMMQLTMMAQLTFSAIHTAAKLGIADLLKDGPRKSEDLARATRANPDAMYRLLRGLTVSGVLREEPGKAFALTVLGATLRSDVPGSMRDLVIFGGEGFRMQPWLEMAHTLRTGQPAFDKVHGAPVFEWAPQHPQEMEVFNRAMTSLSAPEGQMILDAYDFNGFRTLCDVAGGHGGLLATILGKHPRLRGMLVDMPPVAEGAKAALAKQGLQGRVEVVAGDMFDAVPGGADAYILKHIIHDWDDARCVTLLKNIRKVLPRDGTVLIADMVVPGPNEPHYGKLLDLEMLVVTSGGRERTEPEFAALLDQAGLKLSRVVPTQGYMALVEAKPA